MPAQPSRVGPPGARPKTAGAPPVRVQNPLPGEARPPQFGSHDEVMMAAPAAEAEAEATPAATPQPAHTEGPLTEENLPALIKLGIAELWEAPDRQEYLEEALCSV